MKKIILTSAAFTVIALAFATKSNAQSSSPTGTTNMHVILMDALNITVNTTDVTLTFRNPTDYATGRDTTINNHLTVTSNQAYNVNVKAAGTNMASGGNNIATNSVTVSIPSGQTGLGTATPVVLSTTDGTLITGGTAAVNKGINVKYEIPSSISSTNAILGKPAGDYTTVLTYTITQ